VVKHPMRALVTLAMAIFLMTTQDYAAAQVASQVSEGTVSASATAVVEKKPEILKNDLIKNSE